MTTPNKLNEFNHAEDPARRLLEQLGWTYVPSETVGAERTNERDVLLKDRLRTALLRLNDGLTGAQAERVIHDLERVDGLGMERNRLVHEYLTYGMPLTVDGPDGRDTRTVRFFDFDDPEGGGNEFVVTTQFRVLRGNEKGDLNDDQRVVIPDLVLFVNGIPLVVMEAKSPTLMDVWKTQAVRQLRRYQEAEPQWSGAGAPALFHYNLLCVAHCGAAAAFSSLYAPENVYSEWKSVFPYTEQEVRDRFGEEPQGQAQLIVGLLSPATLLDILRDYVIYELDSGKLIKKLPRYQQYRAVSAAMKLLTEGKRPEERGGVVWHTQGSGKSLTMLWLATKLRREPALNNPTIVVLTDRKQLDDQISRTFERCGFPVPEQAASGSDLRRLLTSSTGRTVMTTIQKFEEVLAAPDGELDTLNPADNIIVMVDEAHRTQYGLLGATLSKALPNAVLVGFTGTPIDKNFRFSTMRRFGPLIDAYTIRQSVEDKATVEIRYEARLPDLAIQGADTLDKLFDTLFSEETDEQKEQIKRRYANRDAVAGAERRIQMIALDIADHFKTRVRPNGFKAQVVAPSRLAAMRYARHLNDFHVRAYPIITTTPNDGIEFKEAMGLNQDQVTNDFKNPDGEPDVLVVVDMLLTGFDAPVEQVLYLDRGLQEHGLLQAVARVNRPFTHEHDGASTEKGYGLVVDYYGVSRNLEAALQIFDVPDVMGAMREWDQDPTTALEAAVVAAEAHFKGRDLDDVWDCIAGFAPDASTEGNFKADLYERFNADYREFSSLMDRAIPNPKALPYVGRFARLTQIRAYARAHFLQEDARLNWTDISAKIKKLIDERIDANVRELMQPVSVLDQDFDQKIAALPHDEARASVMEHTIRACINEKLADNPVFYGKLSEQLERIIQDLRNKVIDAAEAAKLQAALKAQIDSEEDIAAELGLSSESFAIYEIIGQGGTSMISEGARAEYHVRMDEEQKEATERVETALTQHRNVVDWQTNHDVQRLMRRDIKRVLRDGEKYTEDELDDLANRIVDAFRSRSGR